MDNNLLIDAIKNTGKYVDKFRNKKVLIKCGGAALNVDENKKSLMQDVALLKKMGLKPIIVHGGGKDINEMCARLNIKTTFVDSLRITTKEVLEVVQMMLGKINKELCAYLSLQGVNALGLSGCDCHLIKAEILDEKLGFVGKIININTNLIDDLLALDIVPVIFPIGLDLSGNALNINADSLSCKMAIDLKVDKIVFLSDVSGLYSDVNNKKLISTISIKEALKLLPQIGGGMKIKLQSCIDALNGGVEFAHIIDGRDNSLLLEFFTSDGIGTLIHKD